jgi:hypothetical protein
MRWSYVRWATAYDSLVEVCRIIGWCNRRKYAGENEDFISPGSL